MSAKNIRVLVTGANGLLATHTILELTKAGILVRGLIRDPRKFQLPAHSLIELIEGDLKDPAAIRLAMEGCTHVVHAAALTSQREVHYATYDEVNVRGTENVLRAANVHRIQRVVLVSTANTLGYGTRANPGDETHAMKEPFTRSLYAQSKKEAERIATTYATELDIVTVHPTFMLGAYDVAPSSGQIIIRAYGKRIVFYPPGGKNFVHVQDAALGVIKALTRGKRGEQYLLANENLSYREFFQMMGNMTANPATLIRVPKWLLLLAGGTAEVLRVMGIRTALSYTNAKVLCVDNFYNNTKSKEDLDLSYQPTAVAVREAVAWFRSKEIIG